MLPYCCQNEDCNSGKIIYIIYIVSDITEVFNTSSKIDMFENAVHNNALLLCVTFARLYYNFTATAAGELLCDDDLLVDLCFQFVHVRDNADEAVTLGELPER